MRPKRKTLPIENHHLAVQVTDDSSRTLVDPASNIAYHSASGACAETRHVYLQNGDVQRRLSLGLPTSVLEIGLGTGFGLLLTLDAALAAGTPLRYTAIENQWLDTRILDQLQLDQRLADPMLVANFLRWRSSLGQRVPHGQYRWQPGPQHWVNIHHVDALEWNPEDSCVYDAIYFDPFAPDANPELWRPQFLSRMHRLLGDGGRLVTYCVSRKVRDDFASAGFHVSRVPGPPGGKREVMIATKM